MSLPRHVSRAKILQLIMQHDAMKNTGGGQLDDGGWAYLNLQVASD